MAVTDEELLRLARKWAETDQVECAEDQYALGVYIEHTHDPLLVLHTAAKRRRAALHAALAVLAGEVDLQALLAMRGRIEFQLVSMEQHYPSTERGEAVLDCARRIREAMEGSAPAEGAGK